MSQKKSKESNQLENAQVIKSRKSSKWKESSLGRGEKLHV